MSDDSREVLRDEAPPTGRLIIPGSGEVVDLATATTDELVEAVDFVGEHLDQVHDIREAVAGELRRRMDRAGQRTVRVGGWKATTNAPTEDVYPEPELRAALMQLVADDHLDEEVIALVIAEGEPRVVVDEPKVRKAEVNKLLKSENPAVQRALGAVRVRRPTRRTLKVEREVRS